MWQRNQRTQSGITVAAVGVQASQTQVGASFITNQSFERYAQTLHDQKEGEEEGPTNTRNTLVSVGVQASPTANHQEQGNISQDEDRRYLRSSSIVILDVGGEKFIALKRTLARLPTTRLGKLVRAETVRCPGVRIVLILTKVFFSKILEYCDEFFPGETLEYFFDKNPENFTSILNIYRTGAGRYYFLESNK